MEFYLYVSNESTTSIPSFGDAIGAQLYRDVIPQLAIHPVMSDSAPLSHRHGVTELAYSAQLDGSPHLRDTTNISFLAKLQKPVGATGAMASYEWGSVTEIPVTSTC